MTEMLTCESICRSGEEAERKLASKQAQLLQTQQALNALQSTAADHSRYFPVLTFTSYINWKAPWLLFFSRQGSLVAVSQQARLDEVSHVDDQLVWTSIPRLLQIAVAYLLSVLLSLCWLCSHGARHDDRSI